LGKVAEFRQWFEKRLDDAIQAAEIEQQQQQQQQETDPATPRNNNNKGKIIMLG
jgi:Sec7-like guanine-nucleotide exchange factor